MSDERADAIPDGVPASVLRRVLQAEHDILFGYCRHLGIPLMSPPRAPEALDAMASEIQALRAAHMARTGEAEALREWKDAWTAQGKIHARQVERLAREHDETRSELERLRAAQPDAERAPQEDDGR